MSLAPRESFSRIFPHLPPFAPPSRELTAALLDIGRPDRSGSVTERFTMLDFLTFGGVDPVSRRQ